MKKTLLLLVLIMSSIAVAFCQPALPQNIRATNTLDRLLDFDGINNYDLMYGIPMEDDKKVLGDTYLTTQWQKSTV